MVSSSPAVPVAGIGESAVSSRHVIPNSICRRKTLRKNNDGTLASRLKFSTAAISRHRTRTLGRPRRQARRNPRYRFARPPQRLRWDRSKKILTPDSSLLMTRPFSNLISALLHAHIIEYTIHPQIPQLQNLPHFAVDYAPAPPCDTLPQQPHRNKGDDTPMQIKSAKQTQSSCKSW